MEKSNLVILFAVVANFSCAFAVIQEGTVGIRRDFGKQSNEVLDPGFHAYNMFSTTILRAPISTTNIEVKLSLPSQEGLNILSEISILYHVVKMSAPKLLAEVGESYEETIIVSVFRSAAADVTANFLAKDMHSGKRYEIETKIQERMNELLNKRGVVIESVLLKSISLPSGLASSVEQKLQAEQDAERMKYILRQEKLEAERRRIEAEGTREAQRILSQGLSPEIIQLRSIEAFKELAKSPNAKVIITDGKTPFLINEDK
ncbi:prohibitin family protein [Leptospira sp. GIMC2001]|uniref:prohibitin family protein n=1 Tax=Leptospira sp. GIMC2001 TaxID=1513297 RepID=UPI00234B1F1B|nr:prohibitin family protein [Leptospira sp. GIMC2001]WCL49987.1 prohibitin family protein [Leptospira sp. GIMC2001]